MIHAYVRLLASRAGINPDGFARKIGGEGVGEPPVGAGFSAVINAIANAVGPDVFKRAPVTLDMILTALENGGMPIAGITDDRRLQLLLIAFCFGAFFEGAAGFGTHVAVTGAILIGLGFSPLAASGLTLIASGGLSLPQAPQADLFLHNPEDTARMMYFDPGLAAAAADRAAQEKNVETAIRNRVASATYGWNPRFCNPHLGKWLHRAQAPALVLWGARDEIVPVATAHEFGRLLPNAQVSILENCGHLPHVEQPDAFLRELNAFI